MNITSKSRYALKIMMDLTANDGELAHRADIAARQGIPLDYMDQILSRLRDCGLISSTRGRSGGYRLARPARTITMLELFTSVEDSFEPVQCLDHGQGCVVEHLCGARDAWSEISAAIHDSLSRLVLEDLVARATKKPSAHAAEGRAAAGGSPFPVPMLQECRAPSKRAHGVEKQ
jgi:Rrf2 family protein